jgi:long-chain acyl-CoA synthetase
MNVLLRAPEVAFYVGDSEARVLITWEDFAEEAMKGVAQLSGVTTYVANKPGSEARPEGSRPFSELMQGSPAFDMVATDPDDTAVILYTSGTTGKPKGAELTHLNLFMCCQVSADRLISIQDDDVALAVLPLFHSFGQSNVMNTTIYAGGTMTLVPRFEVDKVLEVIQRDRVTLFLGVPTMYFALLHHPQAGDYDISSLRLCVSGGASMPGEVMKAFEKKFGGTTILEGYGLSETSPSASFNRSQAERKFLSIGKPVWGVEMRIHDEDDRPLAPGQENVGEIVIRGHNVMKGYFKNPEATAEAMKGGWFHSGDMGYVDADGFFFIVDRKKELIIRGGFNVYPREVEEVLYAHPAVQEAAVIGIPDPKLGEEVKAVVALKQGQSATEEELIAWTKERVAAYKYPRSVQFVETLPKGPTGKILKKELKQQLEAARM